MWPPARDVLGFGIIGNGLPNRLVGRGLGGNPALSAGIGFEKETEAPLPSRPRRRSIFYRDLIRNLDWAARPLYLFRLGATRDWAFLPAFTGLLTANAV